MIPFDHMAVGDKRPEHLMQLTCFLFLDWVWMNTAERRLGLRRATDHARV
jgi:hypothetical protein